MTTTLCQRIEQLHKIAASFRESWKAETGHDLPNCFVIVFNDKPCGYVTKLTNPKTFRPSCIAVPAFRHAVCSIATGGDDTHGATNWEPML